MPKQLVKCLSAACSSAHCWAMDWATALAACRRLILAGVLQSALLFWSCVLTTPHSAPGLQVNDDGTMARTPELLAFAAEHGLKCITIADLVRCTGCVGTVGSGGGGVCSVQHACWHCVSRRLLLLQDSSLPVCRCPCGTGAVSPQA